MTVRPYAPADRAEWARMRSTLWPGQTEADMDAWLARADAATFVADREPAGLAGFVEVGERPGADGCATRPVAYLEGWYVDPDLRQRGVGTALARAAEAWARTQGYRELGSDAALDNLVSRHAHARLGFTEIERLVAYCKPL